jgi:hypothetical protein
VPWHDGRSGSTFGSHSKLDVAPFLTYLREACCLEFALDFTKGSGLSGANLNLYSFHPRRDSSLWGLEMKLQCFT